MGRQSEIFRIKSLIHYATAAGVYTIGTGTNENREQNAYQRCSCASKGYLLDLARASLPLAITLTESGLVSFEKRSNPARLRNFWPLASLMKMTDVSR